MKNIIEFSSTHPATRFTIDSVSIGTLIATFFDWIPKFTALLTFIWVLIRLYETKTVQHHIAKHKERRAKRHSQIKF